MVDKVGITSTVNAGEAFVPASRTAPVLTIHVNEKGIKAIMGKLDDLKSVTKDSEISQKGDAYTFNDKRTGLPLAELDTSSGTLAMYKSPKDMTARIDSMWVKEKDILEFIEKYKVGPVMTSSPGNNMQVAALIK